MQTALDKAISDGAAAEAAMTADESAVTNIKTAIDTASQPLPAAEALLTTDKTTFNAAMDALSAAALAAKVSLPVANVTLPAVLP